MPQLVIATTATSVPMGAQAYEAAVSSRAAAALQDGSSGWSVRRDVARSLRSPLEGDRRLPMGWLTGASPRARRVVGSMTYPRDAVVHRMDLLLPPPPGPHVVTLHDVVAWKYADESTPVTAAAQELRRADAVVCVSRFTAEEAADLLGLDNATVIPNGVDTRYFDAAPLQPGVLADLGLRAPFVLYAGGSAARKNLPGLAEAWRLVAGRAPEWSLALAGPTNDARAALFDGAPRVVHLGRLADEVMPGLVAAAGVVVVPSLYEGFGLPALEAMAVGTPLVCSNRSSLPEVVGDAATLVEPSPRGLSEGLEHVLLGGAALDALTARARARAALFTWEDCARKHADVWRAAAS